MHADSALSHDDLLSVLRGVIDPELNDNVVDLGMIQHVTMNNTGHVDVGIALTTISCPLRSQLKNEIVSKLSGFPGVSSVSTHFSEMSPEEKSALMSRARWKARTDAERTEISPATRTIAVSSGKGGVGKSTTTANLALAIRDQGFSVGILDADIWGFSIPRILGIRERLTGKEGKIDPITGKGIKIVSMGFLVDKEETALMWRGLVLTKAVEQFLKDVRWGQLDYLLVDMPPGTGDVQMGLSRLLPQAEMLVITTPQVLARKVAIRVADMARRSHQKVIGVIENMSGFTCEHGTHYDIFGSGGGEWLAENINVPLLGKIPLEIHTKETAEKGPVVLSTPDSAAAQAYVKAAKKLTSELLPPIEMAGCTARIKDLVESVTGP